MNLKFEAKSDHLKMSIELCSDDSTTNLVFSDPRFALNKRLQAVAIGIRSELVMFLRDVEKELQIGK